MSNKPVKSSTKQKGVKIFFLTIIFFLVPQIFCGCMSNTTKEKYQLIRIHIRADSNEAQAQAVKLKVRDGITDYLTDELCGVTDYAVAYKMLNERLDNLSVLSDGILKRNGYSYGARVKLNNEYFPTRSYDDVVVQSGYYDALIVELGSGKGDNWWCVIYPPLCYVQAGGEGTGFAYKSWLKELWQKYFG